MLAVLRRIPRVTLTAGLRRGTCRAVARVKVRRSRSGVARAELLSAFPPIILLVTVAVS